MAITTRQTGLLVAEDWTKLYQTFRNADFQSYDYETLRKSMVDYLRLYYPEDFNDFIESSEFIALIDLIAFLGQSLAFRSDLNARENYMDTAQRRDSILKLAKLISYNPKRNTPASGFLKIDSVSTTENVFDSNGLNLSGLVIDWADAGNDNWLEQFTAILNASFNANQVVGKPSNSQLINGIINDEYQINLVPSATATFAFGSSVEGIDTKFEMVSATSVNNSFVYESPPRPNSPFNLLYKNDNLGNSSVNTGFFLYFRQGELKTVDLNFQESIPNRVYSVDVNNINNFDIWLYSIDLNGNILEQWSQVPSVGNTNVIYNKSATKTIYQVNSRGGDQIDLVFGDGSFANIPQGRYRLYYRVSNGLQYKITPDELQGITISIDYVNREGRSESINIGASLQYTVANATSRESLDEVRQKAPQQYYTQDRMVTGEDYNILPFTLFNNVLKVKAVNRTSSGVSRYLDVIDTTGKYSSTNIFAQDGILYRDDFVKTFSFDYATTNDIFRVITNQVRPLAASKETLQFFYAFYVKIQLDNTYWNFSTEIANGSTGYLYDIDDKILQVGNVASDSKRFIKQSAIIRFSAGQNNYFDARNRIQTGTPNKSGDKFHIYGAVQQVIGDGTNNGQGNLANGQGPIIINEVVPQGAIADEMFAVFNNDFPSALISSMVSLIEAYEDFGLRYDVDSSSWQIILPQDLNVSAEFSLTSAGNTSGQGMDSSWLIRFQTVGQTYTVLYRGLDYVFESVLETNFYFDDIVKIYDPKTGFTVNDQIKILKVNSNPDDANPLALDYTWFIYKNITEVDGYNNPTKILVTFPDSDSDGIPDNPELFDLIVNPNVNTPEKYVYFQNTFGYDNFVVQTSVSNNLVVSQFTTLQEAQIAATLYRNGQLFYIPNDDAFYQLTIVNDSSYILNQVFDYTAKIGRQDIFFQYRHNSPNYRRIDPSPNNIIDLYLLTKQYSTDYTAWVRDTSRKVAQPFAPTAETLRLEFNQLESFKSISDTIIYNSARFKPIFGAKADPALQATFKVVKNPNVIISDNEIKTSVIAAINAYFDVANWDFGESFYFSELSAYLHSTLAPNIASVIIVPSSESSSFGSLMQINAEYNEIIVSAATVDNIQIISAITAAQINQREGSVVTDVSTSSRSVSSRTSNFTSSLSTGTSTSTPTRPSSSPSISYTPPSGGGGGGGGGGGSSGY